MAKTISVTVSVEIDGTPIPGSPFVFENVYSQLNTIAEQFASGGGNVSFGLLSSKTGLLVFTDQTLTVNPGTITLNGGGMVIIVGASLGAATINNASGNPANVSGYETD